MRYLTPLEKIIVRAWSRLASGGVRPDVISLQDELSEMGMNMPLDSVARHVEELGKLRAFGE